MKSASHHTGFSAYEEGIHLSLEGMKKYGNAAKFQNIRKEMGGLLFDLQRSRSTVAADEQVHYLFLALMHLDNLEQEIRMSSENEEIIRLELIYDKIRSLKSMIAGYIRYLKEGRNF